MQGHLRALQQKKVTCSHLQKGACLKGDVSALGPFQERGEGYKQAVALQVGSAPLEGSVPDIDLWPTLQILAEQLVKSEQCVRHRLQYVLAGNARTHLVESRVHRQQSD